MFRIHIKYPLPPGDNLIAVNKYYFYCCQYNYYIIWTGFCYCFTLLPKDNESKTLRKKKTPEYKENEVFKVVNFDFFPLVVTTKCCSEYTVTMSYSKRNALAYSAGRSNNGKHSITYLLTCLLPASSTHIYLSLINVSTIDFNHLQ